MLVPKATVDEDHSFPGTEDNIGLAGQVRGVQAISVSKLMKDSADNHLRSGM